MTVESMREPFKAMREWAETYGVIYRAGALNTRNPWALVCTSARESEGHEFLVRQCFDFWIVTWDLGGEPVGEARVTEIDEILDLFDTFTLDLETDVPG